MLEQSTRTPEEPDVFRMLIEQSPQGWLILQDQRIVYANARIAQVSGYTRAEFETMAADVLDVLMHPDDRLRLRAHIQATNQGTMDTPTAEYRLLRADGQIRWVAVSVVAIHFGGRPACGLGLYDVHPVKEHARKLAYKTLIDQSPHPVLIRQDGQIVLVSPAAAEIIGYSPEELQALKFEELLVRLMPDDHADLLAWIDQDDQAAHPSVRTFPITRRDGSRRWIECRRSTMLYNDRPAVHLSGTDITAMVDLEASLRESEARYRLITETIADFAYVVRIEADGSRIPEWVIARGDFPGRDHIEVDIREWFERVHPADRRFVQEHFNSRPHGEPVPIEFRVIRQDGAIRWIRTTAQSVWDAQADRVIQVYGAGIDITDRKEQELELQLLREAIEHSPSGVMITDAETRIRYVNPQMTALTGYPAEALLGQTPGLFRSDETPPETYQELWRHMQERREWHGVFCNRKQSGEVYWERASIAPMVNAQGDITHYIAIKNDLTGPRRMHNALRKSRAYLKAIFDNAAISIVVADPRGVCTDINQHGAAMYGYEVDEFIGMPMSAITLPDDIAPVTAAYQALLQGDIRHFRREKEYLRKDGSRFWGDLSMTPILADDGTVEAVVGIVADITERKVAEAALQASEARHRLISNLMSDFAYVFRFGPGDAIAIEWMTDSFMHMIGIPQGESLTPQDWLTIVHPDDHAMVLQRLQRLQAGMTVADTIRVVQPDGAIRWLYDRSQPVFDAERTSLLVYGAGQDVTEQKLAEAAVLQRDTILEALTLVAGTLLDAPTLEQSLPHMLATLGSAIRVSRVSVMENGWLPDGQRCSSLVAEWHAAGLPAHSGDPAFQQIPYNNGCLPKWEQQLRRGEPVYGPIASFPHDEQQGLDCLGIQSIVVVPVMVDGQWWGNIGFDDCATPRFWSGAEIEALRTTAGILGAAIRRTRLEQELRLLNTALEQRVAERTAALVRSEARYRTLVETSPDAILLTDRDGVIQFCNHQTLELLGYSGMDVVTGQHIRDFIEPFAVVDEPLSVVLTTKERQSIEYTLRRKDGTTFPAELRSATLYDEQALASGQIIVLRDISSRKQLQAQLIASERIAIGGRLAASVAHEINTPLQAIQNLLALISDGVAPEYDQYCTLASQEVQRVGRIIAQFLDLYRPRQRVPGPVDLDSTLDRLLMLLGKRIKDQKVRLHRSVGHPPPRVTGHEDALTQVLLNLLINALDAMPHGGALSIDWQYDPQTVTMCITDNGPGIDAALRERIFEPFFTTRPQGIGLGLAICRDLLAEHAGSIAVVSQPGAGSTFAVTLPLYHAEDDDAADG